MNLLSHRPFPRLRGQAKHLGRLGLICALALSFGCDKTVGIDAQRPNFTKVHVPGACRAAGSLAEVDFSVMLMSTRTPIFPNDRLQFAVNTVEETLTKDHFSFKAVGEAFQEPSKVSHANDSLFSDGMLEHGIDLQPSEIHFQYTGGEERVNDRKLVVFLVDSSGSLRGEDVDGSSIAASDQGDGRITFFNSLAEGIDSRHYISLIGFKGNSATVDPKYATPTRNREAIKEGLAQLQRDERGGTPLADALDKAMKQVIEPNYQKLNPVVVLFTDGLENGDTSAASLDTVRNYYANYNGGMGVPIIVVELQPPTAVDPNGTKNRLGRHSNLVDLACETGGEYFFLKDASLLTDSQTNLESWVRTRLGGVWRLRTTTDLGRSDYKPGESFLMTTSLTATLGGHTRSATMERSDSGMDSRIWFYKSSDSSNTGSN